MGHGLQAPGLEEGKNMVFSEVASNLGAASRERTRLITGGELLTLTATLESLQQGGGSQTVFSRILSFSRGAVVGQGRVRTPDPCLN